MLTLTVSELNLPDLPETRIVVYTPRDDDTRAKMPLTRRNPAMAQIHNSLRRRPDPGLAAAREPML